MKYILKGKVPVSCPDLLEWAQWMESADRTVQRTEIGDVLVSTVFLGIDHNFHPGGPPLLFQTMTFRDGAYSRGDQWMTSTWEGAELIHARVITMLRAEIKAL